MAVIAGGSDHREVGDTTAPIHMPASASLKQTTPGVASGGPTLAAGLFAPSPLQANLVLGG